MRLAVRAVLFSLVLACARSGDEPGNAGGEYGRLAGARCGNTDDQAGRGDDAVICAEHGGAQPANGMRLVTFRMDVQSAHSSLR